MRNGLSLFKLRTNNVLPLFSILEKYDVLLPPLYQLFFRYYQTGSFYSFLDFQNLNNEPYNFLTTVIAKDNNIPIFDTLLDENGILNNVHYCEGLDYIPIGYFGSELMLVGSGDENKDIIFKHRFNDRNETDISFLKISDSIFEYINQFEEVESDLFLEFNQHNFYRNWNEDFWRVRKDDKLT